MLYNVLEVSALSLLISVAAVTEILHTATTSFSALMVAFEKTKKENLKQQEQIRDFTRLVATMEANYRALSCLYILTRTGGLKVTTDDATSGEPIFITSNTHRCCCC